MDVALEQAMRLFWLKGYLGTSVSDLTSAMGINRASFYAAFGSKNDLFCKVLDRYGQGPSAYALTALDPIRCRDLYLEVAACVCEKGLTASP